MNLIRVFHHKLESTICSVFLYAFGCWERFRINDWRVFRSRVCSGPVQIHQLPYSEEIAAGKGVRMTIRSSFLSRKGSDLEWRGGGWISIGEELVSAGGGVITWSLPQTLTNAHHKCLLWASPCRFIKSRFNNVSCPTVLQPVGS